MANVYFKFGTQEKFDSLAVKDPHTLYWISDTQRLYKGENLYGIGTLASLTKEGLMSAEDKKALDELVASGASGVFNAPFVKDFPAEGSVNIIYKAEEEKKIYQWDTATSTYEEISVGGDGSVTDITIIDGGNANGLET